MKITQETREILKHYKNLVNERRRESGLSLMTTPQILDEICEFMMHRSEVFIGGQFIQQSLK